MKQFNEAAKQQIIQAKKEEILKLKISELESKISKSAGQEVDKTNELQRQLAQAKDQADRAKSARLSAEDQVKKAQVTAEIARELSGMDQHQHAFVDFAIREPLSDEMLSMEDALPGPKRLQLIRSLRRWDGSYPMNKATLTEVKKALSGVASAEKFVQALENKWAVFTNHLQTKYNIKRWNVDNLINVLRGYEGVSTKLYKIAKDRGIGFKDTSGSPLPYERLLLNFGNQFLKNVNLFEQVLSDLEQPSDTQDFFQQPVVQSAEYKKLQSEHTSLKQQNENLNRQLQSAVGATKAQMLQEKNQLMQKIGSLEQRLQTRPDPGLLKKYEQRMKEMETHFGKAEHGLKTQVGHLKNQLRLSQAQSRNLFADGSGRVLQAGQKIKKLQDEVRKMRTQQRSRPNKDTQRKINKMVAQIGELQKVREEYDVETSLNEATIERLEGTIQKLEGQMQQDLGSRKIHEMEYENVYRGAQLHERNVLNHINHTTRFEDTIEAQANFSPAQRSKAKTAIASAYFDWDGTLPIPQRIANKIVRAVRPVFETNISDDKLRQEFVTNVEQSLVPEAQKIAGELQISQWNKKALKDKLVTLVPSGSTGKSARTKIRNLASQLGIKVYQQDGSTTRMSTLYGRLAGRFLKDPFALRNFFTEMNTRTTEEKDDGDDQENEALAQMRREQVAASEKYSSLEETHQKTLRELDLAREQPGSEETEMLKNLNDQQRQQIDNLQERLTSMAQDPSRATGEQIDYIREALAAALQSNDAVELMHRVRDLSEQVGDIENLPARQPRDETAEHVRTLLERTAEIQQNIRNYTGAPAPVAPQAPPPPPPQPQPSGAGGYKSRIPNNNNIVVKTGQERKVADQIEKLALKQRAQVIKKRKRKPGKTLARNAYMEARRQATAILRKDKKILEDRVKKDVKKLEKSKRKAFKKKKMDEIKAKWKKFKQLFPHWKKVKTIAALKTLTEQVKLHRLKA